MRASFITLLVAASAFAVPIPQKRSILGDIGNALGDLKKNGATLGGVLGAVGDSIKNPALLVSRVEVVKGLNGSAKDLDAIIAQADKTKNDAVSTDAKAAKDGIQSAKDGVSAIGKALFSGGKPQRADQAKVAAGIKAAEDQVNALEAAIVNKDDTLSKSIASAIQNVALARKGGEGVLKASGLSFEDVGLGANPDATTAPPAADAGAAAPPADASQTSSIITTGVPTPSSAAAPAATEAADPAATEAADPAATEAPAADDAQEKATVPNGAISEEEQSDLETRDHPEDETEEDVDFDDEE